MAKERSLDDQLDDVREDDGQIYVERDKVDFDPAEGLLSGTAVGGSSEDDGSAQPSDSAGSGSAESESSDDSGDSRAETGGQ